jgi:hypothetical protein
VSDPKWKIFEKMLDAWKIRQITSITLGNRPITQDTLAEVRGQMKTIAIIKTFQNQYRTEKQKHQMEKWLEHQKDDEGILL